MEICHSHNLSGSPDAREKPFGIRIRLAADDPFRKFVSDDWETFHWFSDAEKRDQVMADMSTRHTYSRIGDEPRLIFEAVNR